MTPDDASPTGEVVLRVVRGHLRFLDAADSLPPERALRDLGLDSLAAIDLLLDLEQALGVTFPEELLTEETFRTTASISRAAARLLASGEDR